LDQGPIAAIATSLDSRRNKREPEIIAPAEGFVPTNKGTGRCIAMVPQTWGANCVMAELSSLRVATRLLLLRCDRLSATCSGAFLTPADNSGRRKVEPAQLPTDEMALRGAAHAIRRHSWNS
jgi:hypothetical protein